MYIYDSERTIILNSNGIKRYNLEEKPDASLVVASFSNNNPPYAIGRYSTKAEAMKALEDLFAALKRDERLFEMPGATA